MSTVMAKYFNPVDPANRIKMSLFHHKVRPLLKGLLFSNHKGNLKRVKAPKYARKYDKECWISKDTNHKIYSQVYVPGALFKDGKSRKMLASRLAWFAVYGRDPGDKYVCHRCDRPKCRNPKHLFLGTSKDNARDKHNKGRGRNFGYPDQNPVVRNLKYALGVTLYRHTDLSKNRILVMLSLNFYRFNGILEERGLK